MLKKVLLILIGIITIMVIGLAVFLYSFGPELPDGTNEIIEQVVQSELPDQLTGDTATVWNGDIKIWYESIYPKDSCKGSVLLFMGIANDAMGWPRYFTDSLLKAGYQVIRSDYRGCGLSDWMEDWSPKTAYTLDDMAEDGLVILDDLSIEKAHILGISLGGMVAQQFAINHPERTLSLCSMMSSGFIEDPELPSINMNTISQLVLLSVKYQLITTEANTIKMHLATRLVLNAGFAYHLNTKALAETVLFNLRERKGYNPKVSPQHLAATSASGSRYRYLTKLTTPSLIIHGYDDPLIPFVHGQRCASLIPDSDSLWLEHMGHDIPIDLNPQIQKALRKHFNKASK